MRRAMESSLLWMRDHPKVTAAVGTAAVAGAYVYGGPPAAALAQKALPFICDVLRLCA